MCSKATWRRSFRHCRLLNRNQMVCVLLLLLLYPLVYTVYTFFIDGMSVIQPVEEPILPGEKTILIWNNQNRRIEASVFGTGRSAFIRNRCPVNRCRIDDAVHSPSLLPLESYDAIVINMNELWWSWLPWLLNRYQLPRWRRQPHQRVVFFTQEPPSYMPFDPANFNDYFNWTMSYRADADVPLLYGRIHRGASPARRKFTKKRTAVWMASHCKTHGLREQYVDQLSRYVDVDIYGRCGDHRCPRNEHDWLSDPKCYDELEANYKFYLSFENSICKDYVTEKFFNILKYDMVPIVYGGGNYERIAPPHSYIDALKYTAQELADYIRLLNANDTMYEEYFEWKASYRAESGIEQMARHGFCDLCRKLHEDQSVQFYPEMVSSWDHRLQCGKSHY